MDESTIWLIIIEVIMSLIFCLTCIHKCQDCIESCIDMTPILLIGQRPESQYPQRLRRKTNFQRHIKNLEAIDLDHSTYSPPVTPK